MLITIHVVTIAYEVLIYREVAPHAALHRKKKPIPAHNSVRSAYTLPVGTSRVMSLRAGKTIIFLLLSLFALAALTSPPAEAKPKKKYKCFGSKATIVGDNSKDTIRGTNRGDVIVSLGGNDTIKSRGGKDKICAGKGNDVVKAGAGNDSIDGGPGKDNLLGQGGKDKIKGGKGEDTCEDATGTEGSSCAFNRAPIAQDDTGQTDEATSVQVDVLANDTDPDGDSLQVSSVNIASTVGEVVVSNNGLDVQYRPDGQFEALGAGEEQTDTFQYTASDGDGEGSTATATITVTGVDDAPEAVDDTSTVVAEDSSPTTINVLENDTDVDAGEKLIQSVTQPAGGEVVVTNGGQDLTYQPDENFCTSEDTTDDFTYTVNGGDTASVKVSVTCASDSPIASDDSFSVNKSASATFINVLNNDSDPDGEDLDVSAIDTTGTQGSVEFTEDGVTYDPDGAFDALEEGETATDTFTYTATDGTTEDTATVTVTVSGDNVPPTAVNDAVTVGEDGGVVDVLANDTDPDSATLTITSLGTSQTNPDVNVTNNGDDVTYTTNGQYDQLGEGDTATDVFFYTVSDGEGGSDTARVDVTIEGSDTAPTAVNDSATVAEDSTDTPINVLSNDTDPDGGDITIEALTPPANGNVEIAGETVEYTPAPNYCNDPGAEETDDFTYAINGGDTATVAVTVTCSGDNPVAGDDTFTVNENSVGDVLNVLANDTDADADDTLSVLSTDTTSTTGEVTNNDNNVTYDPSGNFEDLNTGQEAQDTFTYTVSDGTSTDTATVTVTIQGVDDGPETQADTATVAEDDSASTIDVLANDTDVDGGLKTINSVTQPDNGTVVITNGGDDLTYQPDADYCNDPGVEETDDFTYTVNGGDIGDVSVTVTCSPDAPVAQNDTVIVNESSAGYVLTVLDNDTDPDPSDTLTVSAVDTSSTIGSAVANPDNVIYDPLTNFEYLAAGENANDTLSYTVSDGNGGEDSANVSITVQGENDAPVAQDDSDIVAEDSINNLINVLNNDTDIDSSDTLSIISVDDPANGSASIAGDQIEYAPDLGYCNDDDATDDFTYTVSDGNGGSASATISMAVECTP